MKTIVVYFSRKGLNYVNREIRDLPKGNAEMIAEIICQHQAVDVFKIETVQQYPKDYQACTSIAKLELQEDARPKITDYVHHFEQYENIILIYPNWWGTMPMAVRTFLDMHDLKNKKIYPICTHEGSYMGHSENDLKKYYPQAIIKPGLALRGTDLTKSESALKNYIHHI